MLKDVSQIKISGGCEVFAEARITFTPLGHDKAMVQLDNSGSWFYDDYSNPIPAFKIKVYAKQLSVFINDWVELMDSVQRNPDYASTREATITADFFLHDKEVRYSFSENQGGYQLDPIIESVEAFVATCHKKVNPPPDDYSKQKFSPKNKTEAFLGAPEERENVILQFNNMSGLHGGRTIVVNGLGNAMVLLVYYDDEHKKMWEQRYTFDISPARLEEIYAAIVNNDVLTIQLEDRTGVPDEVRIHLSISNAENDFFKLETWEQSHLPPGASQDNPRVKFDKACLPLKRLEHIAKTEQAPVQEGPYVSP